MRIGLVCLAFVAIGCTTFAASENTTAPGADAGDGRDAGDASDASASPSIIASDSFERTVGAGFGNADLGGAWRTNNSATNFISMEVGNGTGNVLTHPGATGTAYLDGITVTDVDLHATFSSDKFHDPDNSLYLTLAARDFAPNAYVCIGHVVSSGELVISISRGGTSADQIDSKTSGLVMSANEAFHLRFVVTSANPTTLKCRAWRGATEPSDWLVQASDSTAVLQKAGNVGVRAYLSMGGTVDSLVHVDDFVARVPSP